METNIMDEKKVPEVDCLDRNKKSKISKKSKKRKHSSSDNDSSPKRLKVKKHKKKCKKKHKHTKGKKYARSAKASPTDSDSNEEGNIGPEVPKEILQKAQSLAPMSKEEWEMKQSIITRVFDETTGRSRLIRGEGEIIEEIVSKERHKAINRQATQGDGDFFQSKIKKIF